MLLKVLGAFHAETVVVKPRFFGYLNSMSGNVFNRRSWNQSVCRKLREKKIKFCIAWDTLMPMSFSWIKEDNESVMWTLPSVTKFYCCCFFLTLLCHWDLSCRKVGCFPWGKPAATESRYPTYSASQVYKCFHNPLASDMDFRISLFIVRMWFLLLFVLFLVFWFCTCGQWLKT